MPYGGIVNNGIHRVSSATASFQRIATRQDDETASEPAVRTVGLSKLITNVVQTQGALLGTVTVQGKVGDDTDGGISWFTIDTFTLPALNSAVHRAYDIPGFRLARVIISNPAGAGDAVYPYMLGAGI